MSYCACIACLGTIIYVCVCAMRSSLCLLLLEHVCILIFQARIRGIHIGNAQLDGPARLSYELMVLKVTLVINSFFVRQLAAEKEMAAEILLSLSLSLNVDNLN